MKVNPTMIPPALNLVIAQRLVRKVCSKCSKEINPDKETIEKIKDGLENLPARGASELARVAGGPKLDNITIKQANPQGCAYCNFTGYKGRVGVFELFIIDDAMEKVILKTPSNVEIKESAIKAGMVLMRQDGLLKVLQKITTMDEVERILGV
jgi:type II secretory ATPase GspE/PulE/Tfp pilus assembly ATPase PilB-like protein